MDNFWDYHGCWFIFFMFFFPRLTMLFATTTVSGGFLYLLGWLFAPRLTVAIIATTYFWQANTFLCVLTWFWAIGGEYTEKVVVRSQAT